MPDPADEPEFDCPEDLLAAIREQQRHEDVIDSEIDHFKEELKEKRAALKLAREARIKLVNMSKKLFPER